MSDWCPRFASLCAAAYRKPGQLPVVTLDGGYAGDDLSGCGKSGGGRI